MKWAFAVYALAFGASKRCYDHIILYCSKNGNEIQCLRSVETTAIGKRGFLCDLHDSHPSQPDHSMPFYPPARKWKVKAAVPCSMLQQIPALKSRDMSRRHTHLGTPDLCEHQVPCAARVKDSDSKSNSIGIWPTWSLFEVSCLAMLIIATLIHIACLGTPSVMFGKSPFVNIVITAWWRHETAIAHYFLLQSCWVVE